MRASRSKQEPVTCQAGFQRTSRDTAKGEQGSGQVNVPALASFQLSEPLEDESESLLGACRPARLAGMHRGQKLWLAGQEPLSNRLAP